MDRVVSGIRCCRRFDSSSTAMVARLDYRPVGSIALLFVLYARDPIWARALLQVPILGALDWAWHSDPGRQ